MKDASNINASRTKNALSINVLRRQVSALMELMRGLIGAAHAGLSIARIPRRVDLSNLARWPSARSRGAVSMLVAELLAHPARDDAVGEFCPLRRQLQRSTGHRSP